MLNFLMVRLQTLHNKTAIGAHNRAGGHKGEVRLINTQHSLVFI